MYGEQKGEYVFLNQGFKGWPYLEYFIFMWFKWMEFKFEIP